MSKSDKGGVPEIRWGEGFVREVGVEYTSTDTELFEWRFPRQGTKDVTWEGFQPNGGGRGAAL